MVTILGVLVARKREWRGRGGVGHNPPSRQSIGGEGSVFFRILHRKIAELLFIETARNYRKTFFSVFHRFDHSEIHLKIKHKFAQEKAVFHRFLFHSFRQRFLLPKILHT